MFQRRNSRKGGQQGIQNIIIFINRINSKQEIIIYQYENYTITNKKTTLITKK